MTAAKPTLRPILFPDDASRQRHFWRLIGPRLQALPWLAALWLGGSGARGDGDRWSSVDLHLLVAEEAELLMTESRLCALLDELFSDGWSHFGLQSLGHTTFFAAITHARLPAAANTGGVLFRLHWTTPDDLAIHRAWHGPLHLLFVRDDLPDEQRAFLTAPTATLHKGEAGAVQAGLTAFWQLLAHLPAAINREEHLAAASLLNSVRSVLTDLVVALNGATRPASLARINPFLGPAQREAFEKTLRHSANDTESWIGQAVALIVLYRWYAPQLVEMYRLDHPQRLEETVLALLCVEIPGWPARITTA
ncbi:MAG: hypothetical protein HY328_14585 [Chloroflexi bacterium]|nr:hypothetical protein [Chloroflexota bacterium]